MAMADVAWAPLLSCRLRELFAASHIDMDIDFIKDRQAPDRTSRARLRRPICSGATRLPLPPIPPQQRPPMRSAPHPRAQAADRAPTPLADRRRRVPARTNRAAPTRRGPPCARTAGRSSGPNGIRRRSRSAPSECARVTGRGKIARGRGPKRPRACRRARSTRTASVDLPCVRDQSQSQHLRITLLR